MLIGKRISGRYKIINLIGGGGMANVYLARDMILERDVAIKILRLDFSNDEEFIRRFRREAQSATSLAHPNIVNIYDVGEEEDIYYIVMEYVEGMTLKQYIQHHSPLKVQKALDIMKQLTSAIAHAHQNHIIHRDIKPQNILVDKNENVKITDFGIATALSATTITHTNSVLGSVHYLSPEQARGQMTTKKSDIYSLGIVMFELLTGRLPFSGESAVSIALKHLQSETPSPRQWNPDIPQSVENIILKATAKDPHYRYDSVEEMEEDLHTSLDPNRINEPPFRVPVDEEATKAIPVIADEKPFRNLEETKIHDKENQNNENGKTEEAVKKDKKNNNKKKKGNIIIASILGAIVLLALFTFIMFPGIFGPKQIEVPDVRELELEEAIEKLTDAGLEIGETMELSSDEIPEKHVIKTDPKQGRKVNEGTKVNIYISTGKEKLSFSDYRGRMFDDVIELLKDDYKDILKEEVFDDSEPGTIIDQDPKPDEEIVPEETVITFIVSKGPETFKLADLKEYSVNGVNDYAATHGLKIDMTKEEHHDTIPKGYIISQDPPPGTEVRKGDTVIVVISKGPKEQPPKQVSREVTIEYTGSGGTPQTIQIFIDDMNNDYQTPSRTFTITETRTVHLEFLIAPNTQGKYKITRDGEVVEEEIIHYPNN
jgi:eukaryotic-like serine/threonine-protein kinase